MRRLMPFARSFDRLLLRRIKISQLAANMDSSSDAKSPKCGIVLGVYKNGEAENASLKYTEAAQTFNQTCNGLLDKQLQVVGPSGLKEGKSLTFYGLAKQYPFTSVVCLGSKDAGYNALEEVQENREHVRVSVAGGTKQLRDAGATNITVDPCGDDEAAAEGAHLGLFTYDELKKESSKKPRVSLSRFQSGGSSQAWEEGMIKAEGQNFARKLMETPANLMTPMKFATTVQETLGKKGVEVVIWDRQWAEKQKMGSFLSVGKGSAVEPVFLEIKYNRGPDGSNPLVLVGKGITFDSGGISLKPAAGMDRMRGDMGGAACTVGTIYTLAALKVPINVIGLIPLCENMPSGTANKPGDVVYAMNGKSIQVDNTDAEGRLILADALCYSATFNPKVVLDVATLTGAMAVALGSAATGVFTNSDKMWQLIHKAGQVTGDRMWRMPLFKHFTKQVTESHLADVNNIGKDGRMGGSCTAAAFLKEFVDCSHWLHLDIAGVMENKDEVPYLTKGLTGRPTRTMVEFAKMLARETDI